MLAQVTKDDERYAYALSKIEPKQAKEVKDFITRPPSQGKKPSQFLRHLTALAGATVSPELLRTMWLGRLPPQIQAILATRSADNLEDVAEQADHILEVESKAIVAATTTSHKKAQAKQQISDHQIEALTKQVAMLTAQMSAMAKAMKLQQNGRSRSRSRSRIKTPQEPGICFYHRRFGKEACKCTQPCTYKPKNAAGGH
ncbi:PREDICTED: uncharacterized protein LOC105459734 [Wasmannia auropunctata]|uniref:uncharacterized protein LOC105459734 n=1 Tax=Wasmannia auropunctata TaxID=64793 RepID=UPI0005F04CA9|nr:PREDICTED: uncharacterized protein LOC105459734 [Wasmannia auropunctata]